MGEQYKRQLAYSSLTQQEQKRQPPRGGFFIMDCPVCGTELEIINTYFRYCELCEYAFLLEEVENARIRNKRYISGKSNNV